MTDEITFRDIARQWRDELRKSRGTVRGQLASTVQGMIPRPSNILPFSARSKPARHPKPTPQPTTDASGSDFDDRIQMGIDSLSDGKQKIQTAISLFQCEACEEKGGVVLKALEDYEIEMRAAFEEIKDEI